MTSSATVVGGPHQLPVVSGAMTEEEYRKTIGAIWTRQERKYRVRVAPELRLMLEHRCLGVDHDTEVDLRDFAQDVDGFIGQELPLIMALVQRLAANPQAGNLPERVKLRGRTRVYQKPFERRLRILDFVAQHRVPFEHLLQRSLDTAGRRIGWDDMCAKWNSEHPDDVMKPEQLRVMYERARREQYLRETYFDGKFRDWAKQGEALRPTLTWLEAAGLRPEDLFVKRVPHRVEGLAEDAHQFLAEAQDLRQANQVEGIDPAARKANEEKVVDFERVARTLKRAGEVKEWAVISAKLPPSAARALARAIKRKCGLTEGFVAYPRGTVFCERPRCHKCKVGADLLKERLITVQGGLRASSAKGAAERHKEKLQRSNETWRKLREWAQRQSPHD
jgi:hypothetical protein